VADLHKADNVSRKELLDDWVVELSELEPGVETMLVFDFIDYADLVLMIGHESIDLANTLAVPIPELDPWSLTVFDLVHAQRHKRQMFMRLTLVADTDSEPASRPTALDPGWFAAKELCTPDVNRWPEPSR